MIMALLGIASIRLIISSKASKKSSFVAFGASCIVGTTIFPSSSTRKKLSQLAAPHPSFSPPLT